MSEVAVIILAAGLGTRFGAKPKALATLHGRPLIRHVVDAALALLARDVSVVLGHRGPEIAQALRGLPIRHILNPDYATGLASSLRAGFAALPAGARGAIIMLADMPGVTAATVDVLIEAWRAAGEPIAVVPVHGGRRGNPVLLSLALEGEIAALRGDQGAGPILRGRAGVLEVDCDDPAILADIDTPDALRSLN